MAKAAGMDGKPRRKSSADRRLSPEARSLGQKSPLMERREAMRRWRSGVAAWMTTAPDTNVRLAALHSPSRNHLLVGWGETKRKLAPPLARAALTRA